MIPCVSCFFLKTRQCKILLRMRINRSTKWVKSFFETFVLNSYNVQENLQIGVQKCVQINAIVSFGHIRLDFIYVLMLSEHFCHIHVWSCVWMCLSLLVSFTGGLRAQDRRLSGGRAPLPDEHLSHSLHRPSSTYGSVRPSSRKSWTKLCSILWITQGNN